MVLDRVFSVTGVLIRLTHERWKHISENHTEIVDLRQEVLETVHKPDFIVKDAFGAFYACRYYQHLENTMVVIYKETENDGFVITAFRVRNIKPYMRKEIIWQKQS